METEFEIILNTNKVVKDLWGKTVLITGVTGTVGSFLFEFLNYCNERHEAMIKLVCPVRNFSKISNEWKHYVNVEWIDYYAVDEYSSPINYLIHCASPARSQEFVEKPVETIDAIVFGTKRFLELFKRCGGNGFLYLSSVEIYGDNTDMKKSFKESTIGAVDTLNLRSSYPESKRLVENMCIAYAAEYDLSIKIARLTQVLGFNAGDDRLIAYLCNSAAEKRQIVLKSDGKATKSYCYIADCISAMLYILIAGKKTAYNIANADMCASVYDLAKIISDKYIGLPVLVENKVDEKYPISSRLILDASKLQELGWSPQFDLDVSLEKLVAKAKEKRDTL